MAANLAFPTAIEQPAETIWRILASQSGDDGYDRITVSPGKDFSEALFTLAVGQWSPKIVTRIKMQDGSTREVMFRCKLIELSDDAEDFRLFITSMIETRRFRFPAGSGRKDTVAPKVCRSLAAA